MFNNKKKILILILILPILFIISACGPKKVDLGPLVDPSVARVDSSNNFFGTKVNTTTSNKKNNNPVVCERDQACFLNKFKECSPSEFKLSSEGGEYNLIVTGFAGGRCYFQGGFYKNGALIHSGIDCRLPKNFISNDTIEHFLGRDKGTGKEEIKASQDKIENEYCKKIEK